MSAVLGVVCGAGPILALGVVMDRIDQRAHNRRMAALDERSSRAREVTA